MPSQSFLDGRITIDPDLCNGRPTLRGKRIAVQTILEYLGAGDSVLQRIWPRVEELSASSRLVIVRQTLIECVS
ncbi:MAG: DUF433 domain-containing protein [Rhodoferax sp.]